jgi:hypothetical protein
MRSIRLAAVVGVLAALVAGCDSAQPTANSTPPVPPASGSQPASQSAVPTTSATATASAAATTVDPCQLVTQQEASTLTGVSYGPGKLEVGGSATSRRCVYGYQTRHVFTVIIVQAASADDAKAYAATLRAQAQHDLGAQVTLKQVTGIGDDAETLRGNRAGIDVSGLYVLSGAYGLALVDVTLGHAAGLDVLTAQAQTALDRLP